MLCLLTVCTVVAVALCHCMPTVIAVSFQLSAMRKTFFYTGNLFTQLNITVTSTTPDDQQVS